MCKEVFLLVTIKKVENSCCKLCLLGLRTYKYLILHAPHLAFNLFFSEISCFFRENKDFQVLGRLLSNVWQVRRSWHDQNARTDDIDNVEYILGVEKDVTLLQNTSIVLTNNIFLI
jgi:hypothetical protein